MITAVDTNVLLDLFTDSKAFADAAEERIRVCLREGALVACDLVWAELAAVFPSADAMQRAMDALHVAFSPCNASTATKAGLLWRQYRAHGGARARILPDFLIGAHALMQADRLLSRDRGFYRAHFAPLIVMDPAHQ